MRRGVRRRRRRPHAVLLVQLVRVGLDHVDEVGEALLLVDRDRLEVLGNGVGQLRLVHARPRGHLVVALVAAQRVDLQLEQIDLGQIGVRLVAVLLRVLATSLGARALDARLVEVTDVDVGRL